MTKYDDFGEILIIDVLEAYAHSGVGCAGDSVCWTHGGPHAVDHGTGWSNWSCEGSPSICVLYS